MFSDVTVVLLRHSRPFETINEKIPQTIPNGIFQKKEEENEGYTIGRRAKGHVQEFDNKRWYPAGKIFRGRLVPSVEFTNYR